MALLTGKEIQLPSVGSNRVGPTAMVGWVYPSLSQVSHVDRWPSVNLTSRDTDGHYIFKDATSVRPFGNYTSYLTRKGHSLLAQTL